MAETVSLATRQHALELGLALWLQLSDLAHHRVALLGLVTADQSVQRVVAVHCASWSEPDVAEHDARHDSFRHDAPDELPVLELKSHFSVEDSRGFVQADVRLQFQTAV